MRAKTGTLAHVSALSGYLETSAGGQIAFSILANNYNENRALLRAVMDRICLALLD